MHPTLTGHSHYQTSPSLRGLASSTGAQEPPSCCPEIPAATGARPGTREGNGELRGGEGRAGAATCLHGDKHALPRERQAVPLLLRQRSAKTLVPLLHLTPWPCKAPASPLLHGPREPAGASLLPRVPPGLEHRGRRGFGGAAFARRERRAERAALPVAPGLKMPWEEAAGGVGASRAAPRTSALFAEKQHPARANPSGVPAPLPLLFALLRRGVCLQYDSLQSLFTVSQPLPSRSFSFVNPRVLSLPNLDDKAFQAGTVSFLISLKCQPLLTVLDKYLMIIIELDSNNAQPHLHFLSPFRHRLIN